MKQSLTNLGVVLVIAGIVFAGYRIWDSIVLAKSAVVANVDHRIMVKTETASRITSVRASLSEIESDEKNIQNYFVSKTKVVTFIDDLERQGRALGAMVGVSSVAVVDTAEYPTLTLTFSIEGTFDAVMRTIGSIEYAPYDLSVASLSVKQLSARAWYADLKIFVGSIEVSKKEDSTLNQVTPL